LMTEHWHCPAVLRGGVTWPALAWTETDWTQAVQSRQLAVRVGQLEPALPHPQWERHTSTVQFSPQQLFSAELRGQRLSPGCWAYWDYQYLSHVLAPHLVAGFSWAGLGRPDHTGEDSALWAGTRGAHTPLHQDSYGENLVAQLVGTKVWTLFPPAATTHLSPTRAPYEESSVYSKLNLRQLESNSEHQLAALSGVTSYQVTLSPGDVLYVPPGWWHEVVTTSAWAISVNTWLAVSGDATARLGEALVRLTIAGIVRAASSEARLLLLNPNEDDLPGTDPGELVALVETARAAAAAERTQPAPSPAPSRPPPSLTQGWTLVKQCRLKLPAPGPAPSSSDITSPPAHQKEAARLADLIDSLTEPEAVTIAANRLLSK